MNGQQPTRELGRRELNRMEKLQSIESAGRDLFFAKGFEETTTRELARSAGVGTGTLFLYFPEKRDLLLHLFHRELVEVNTRAFETVPHDAPFAEQLSHDHRTAHAASDRAARASFIRRLERRPSARDRDTSDSESGCTGSPVPTGAIAATLTTVSPAPSPGPPGSATLCYYWEPVERGNDWGMSASAKPSTAIAAESL